MSVCGARLRGSDPPRFCRKRPLRGRTRCRLHGGRSLAGPESPTWKTGMFSHVLDGSCARAYRARRADPGLVGLREHIALVDAQLLDTLERVRTGESLTAWERVGVALDALRDARARGDDAAIDKLLGEAEHARSQGAAAAAAAVDVDRQLRLRARLTIAESRRVAFAHEHLSKDVVNQLLVMITTTVKQLVPDPNVLRAIVEAFRRLQAPRDVNVHRIPGP